MKEWLNRFDHINETIYFNEEECLRERTRSPIKVNNYIQAGERLLEYEDLEKEDAYVVRGLIGNLYRIIDETDASIDYLLLNVHYAKQVNNPSKEIVSRIRLGESLKYAGQFTLALEEFEDAKRIADTLKNNNMHDFIYQHLGKLYLELIEYEKAMHVFKEAHTIRVDKGNEDLINSTYTAITFTQEKIKEL